MGRGKISSTQLILQSILVRPQRPRRAKKPDNYHIYERDLGQYPREQIKS